MMEESLHKERGMKMSATEATTTLTGTWKNGQVVLDGPADWPEGCRVIVEPIAAPAEALGVRNRDAASCF